MYYTNVVHVVVELPHFDASAKAAGLSDDERCRLVDHLAKHPATGDLIPGTGGARKVRLAGRGKGKSGGYRVITFYTVPACPCSSSPCSRRVTA